MPLTASEYRQLKTNAQWDRRFWREFRQAVGKDATAAMHDGGGLDPRWFRVIAELGIRSQERGITPTQAARRTASDVLKVLGFP